jgi:acetyltransferase-like isoleucine patch superfamily enzyme
LLRLAGPETSHDQPLPRIVQGAAQLLPQFCFNRLRTALWRAVGIPIGEGSLLMGDLSLSGAGDWASLFSVGEHTYITGPLTANLGGAVRIGNAVNIGHHCLFLTVDHDTGPPWRRAGASKYGSIVIEDGAWITSRVTVLPGVTIGKGAIVAAGAVVASHVAPNTLVAGVPAKLVRTLDVTWPVSG